MFQKISAFKQLKDKKGFSLAEMMVVMTVFSIILAASTTVITKRTNKVSSGGESIPSGVIVIWKGSTATIPAGWVLCDGSNGTPDLRSRFVYGAGADGSTKTAWTNSWNAAALGHFVSGATGGEETNVLTIAEMPSHSHSGSTNISHTHTFNTNNDGAHTHTFSNAFYRKEMQFVNPSSYYYLDSSSSTGHIKSIYSPNTTSTTHYHSGTTAAGGSMANPVSILANGTGNAHLTMPRYFALAYIMKQ